MDRNLYLDRLIGKKHNGLIKIITGIRRCGKSYLLFNLYKAHFLSAMVSPDPIITLELDDRINKQYRNPDFLCSYVRENIKDDKMYYILLDEVQMMDDFEDILNIFLHISNVDVDVTGSNAKFLSKDIITEFRGRGEQVHLFPFCFSEFMQGCANGEYQAWLEYI